MMSGDTPKSPKASFEWKETLVYSEEGKRLCFEAPIGKGPPFDVFVPSAQKWDNVVPDWAKGRRTEIINIISNTEALGKIIEDDFCRVET